MNKLDRLTEATILALRGKLTESYYYDIHVVEDEDTGTGYSAFLKIDKHFDENQDRENIVKQAIDNNILEADEVEFVDNITEIDEEEYNRAVKA